MPLGLLAADFVGAIIPGEEQSGPSLERLTKGVPMSWVEQQQRFVEPAHTTRTEPLAAV